MQLCKEEPEINVNRVEAICEQSGCKYIPSTASTSCLLIAFWRSRYFEIRDRSSCGIRPLMYLRTSSSLARISFDIHLSNCDVISGTKRDVA
jgi:hypothetical protein